MNRTKMPNLVFLIPYQCFVAYFGHFSAIQLVCRCAIFSLYIYLQGWKHKLLQFLSILISDKRSRKGIENRRNGLILPLAITTCLIRMFPARNRWKTPYRQGPKFKFVTHRVWMGDKALVSVAGTN